jgi:septal ring factor EnvC (AmiA/AmiB activator)
MKNKFDKRLHDNKFSKFIQDNEQYIKSKRTIAIIVLTILLLFSCSLKNDKKNSIVSQDNSEQIKSLTASIEEKESIIKEKDNQIKQLYEEKSALEEQKNSLEKDLNSQITELQSRVNEDRDKNTYSKTNTTAVQNNEVSMPQSNMVYVTDTGKKYHRDGCQYLKKSKRAITLQDAQKQGYTPCSKCY